MELVYCRRDTEVEINMEGIEGLGRNYYGHVQLPVDTQDTCGAQPSGSRWGWPGNKANNLTMDVQTRKVTITV